MQDYTKPKDPTLDLKSTLSPRGYNVLKTALKPHELAAIKNELSVIPHVPGGPMPGAKPIEPNKLYLESDTRIYVPKAYGLARWGPPETIKIKPGAEVILTFQGSLRPEQAEPVDAMLRACRDPNKMGGILNVFCGGGKTTMALYIAVVLKRKTLIVVHKDFLLEQWSERIKQFVPDASVGTIKAKVIDVKDHDIVIASLQSLSMKEYDPAVFSDFGTVIIDEVHHTSAEVFSKALRKITFTYSIGLSATITRKDGLAKVFIWFLGPVAYKAAKRHDHIDVKQIDFMSPASEYSKVHMISTTKPNVSRMINNICEFMPRNDLIVSKIHEIFQEAPTRRMLVLSDRRAHLFQLQSMIKKEITTGIYVGGMKTAVLANNTSQIMFATYAIASEGYDQPGLDTLVLASPRSDVTQSVGRILRDKPEARRNVPLVIDIVDGFSLFISQGNKRRAFYKKCSS